MLPEWWTRRRFRFANIFRSPYKSELLTAYAQMCTRIRHKVPSEFNSQVKFLKKKKGVRKALLFSFWWNRRELNPCPKTSWYNLLRGQSYLLKFPFVSADRQAMTPVALLCLTDTRAKSRFKFTTNLTHGGSRSPHPRYGRHFWPRHSLRCKSNFIVVVYFLSWTF